MGDGGIGDVAFFPVQNVVRSVFAGPRLHLDVGRVRPRIFFSQSEGGQLLTGHQLGQPPLFLGMAAEKQQGANADRVMSVHENRSRRAPAPDLFQDPAIRHLRKPVSAKFLGSGHSEHAHPAEPVDDAAGNIFFPIDRRRVEAAVEKLTEIRHRLIQFRLLGRWNSRVGNDPVGYKTSEKKALGEPERFRPGQKQFFGLGDFLLPLCFGLSHEKIRIGIPTERRPGQGIVAGSADLST